MMNQSDQTEPMKEWISEKEEIERFLNSEDSYDKNYFHFRKKLYSQQTLRQRSPNGKEPSPWPANMERKKVKERNKRKEWPHERLEMDIRFSCPSLLCCPGRMRRRGAGLFFAKPCGPADRPPRCTVCGTGTMLTITRRETITSRHPCMHGHERYDGMAKYDENTYYECNTCHYGARTASVYVGESFMYCEYAVS